MSVVRLTIAYDGTEFRGWARQRGQRTVQGVLEGALQRFLRELPRLSVAGRTDAGVHARGQVVSFPADDGLDIERLQRALSGMLAPEIAVLDARWAPDGFDARRSATAREYRYRIDVGPVPDPFTAPFVWHRPGDLSLSRMRTAGRGLVGEHDFASFCRAPQGDASTVRRLERLAVSRNGERIEIAARANSFLHQMVRSLVGTLVSVGEGRIEPGDMPAVLAARDRSAAGPIAPPHGLTLERVVFGQSERRPER
jgi:tRNA pseudouridine38-40 synthase